MTIAAVYASNQAVPNQRTVGLIVDSRALFGNNLHFDGYIKARVLGLRSAVVGFGSTIPSMTAAEIVRPILSATADERARNGRRSMSLWDEAGLFVRFMRQFHSDFMRADADAKSGAFLIGFFGDGVPGIVDVRLESRSFASINIYRPQFGAVESRVFGPDDYAPILAEAMRRSASAHNFSSIFSVFVSMSMNEALVGVGGGICFGACSAADTAFGWPFYEVDGKCYHRGFEFPPPHPPHWPKPMSIRYDPALLPLLEQENQLSPFYAGGAPVAGSTSMPDLFIGTPNLLEGPEPEWTGEESPGSLGTTVKAWDQDGNESDLASDMRHAARCEPCPCGSSRTFAECHGAET